MSDLLSPVAGALPSGCEIICMPASHLVWRMRPKGNICHCFLRLDNVDAVIFRDFSHMHSCDGFCFLDDWHQEDVGSCCKQIAAAAVLTTVVWLRNLIDTKTPVSLARVVCVCETGLHTSIFVGRILQLVLGLLFQNLDLFETQVRFKWIQEENYKPRSRTNPDQVVSSGSHTCETRHVELKTSVGDARHGEGDLRILGVDLESCFWTSPSGFRSCISNFQMDLKSFVCWTVTSLYGPLADLLPQCEFDYLLESLGEVIVTSDWVPVIDTVIQVFPRKCAVCSRMENLAFAWRGSVAELAFQLAMPDRSQRQSRCRSRSSRRCG